MTKEIALITGASSGIGLELARQFASEGHPLILTASRETELRRIARHLEDAHGVDVYTIAADLNDEEAPEDLLAEIERQGLPVEILVNNAGLGQKGKFWQIPLEKDLTMLRVNVEAPLRLTKLFLPPMLKRARGRILNTASVAGFEPGPLLAVYHATKAFVLSFTEALAVELAGSGISVTALCPGPTDTDFFPKANMTRTRIFQKGDVMSPQEVAAAGYKALMGGEALCIPGASNKAMVFARRLTSVTSQARLNKKFYEDVKPTAQKRRSGEVKEAQRQKILARARVTAL